MKIPFYPDFAPVTLAMRGELHPLFSSLTAGISEFTFAGIYLFRKTYQYKISRLEGGKLAISGQRYGKSFFTLPWGIPSEEVFRQLMATHDFLKGFSLEQVGEYGELLKSWGFEARPDRDNWDYLYDSGEMAELAGKKFHKKRNLIHQYEAENGPIRRDNLTPANLPQALHVLDLWGRLHDQPGDLEASREALDLWDVLGLTGAVFLAGDTVVGYTLGEAIVPGKSYVIHFEKADPSFKGVYQALFQSWARELSPSYPLINREQDLGDPGLKQAKETYRPVGFVEKYTLWPQGSTNL